VREKETVCVCLCVYERERDSVSLKKIGFKNIRGLTRNIRGWGGGIRKHDSIQRIMHIAVLYVGADWLRKKHSWNCTHTSPHYHTVTHMQR